MTKNKSLIFICVLVWIISGCYNSQIDRAKINQGSENNNKSIDVELTSEKSPNNENDNISYSPIIYNGIL